MIRLSKPKALTVPEVEQSFLIVPFPQKFDVLGRVLDASQSERTLVFAATKRMVDEVGERLQARGYSAESLHSDVSQAMREKILRNFREGRTEVLVATDVAARGLDISGVALVVNFDIPPDPEYYVHRVGRTARVGRRGQAITFVNPRELRELKAIERLTGAHIKRGTVPTVIDAEEREFRVLAERLVEALGKNEWGRYRAVAELLADDYEPTDIAAAAISLAARPRAASKSSQKEESARSPQQPARQSSHPKRSAPAYRRSRSSAPKRRS